MGNWFDFTMLFLNFLPEEGFLCDSPSHFPGNGNGFFDALPGVAYNSTVIQSIPATAGKWE
jgi:hypothetical protein